MCERRIKDFDTGEYVYQLGEGFFDSITTLLGKAGSKVAEKGTKIASNRLAKKVGALALEKAGEKIVNKILPPPIDRIEKNLEDKGSQIIEELEKMQPKENKTPDKATSARSSINEEFDKIINMLIPRLSAKFNLM